MAHLLSEKDFRGNVNIAGTEQTIVKAEVCKYIADHEPVFLAAVLGYALSKAFTDGAAEESHDQKWQDLWEGVEYTHGDFTRKWVGLKYLAVRYVYYKYAESLFTLTTTAGEKIPQMDNATPAEAKVKAIKRWTEMRANLDALSDYLRNAKTGEDLIYPEWDNGRYVNPCVIGSINRWDI